MNIKKVLYGANETFIDVTDIIIKVLKKSDSFKVCNELFTDPLIGVVKYMTIEYENGDKKIYKENDIYISTNNKHLMTNEYRLKFYLGNLSKNIVNLSETNYKINENIHDGLFIFNRHSKINTTYHDNMRKFFNMIDDKYKDKNIMALFGDDSKTIPLIPIVSKVRRIGLDNSNRIILKLNHARHWGMLESISNIDRPYNKKNNKIIWRGTTTGGIENNPREILIKKFQEHSNKDIDIKFNIICQDYNNNKKEYILGKSMSFKDKINQAEKQYYQNNKEKIQQYYLNNRKQILSRVKEYQSQPDIKKKTKEYMYSYLKNRRTVDILFNLSNTLRARINSALKTNSKKSKSFDLLGCSVEDYKIYIENQFKKGMDWKNWGTVWEIDHIKPCSSFDLTNLDHQKQCFNNAPSHSKEIAEILTRNPRLIDRKSIQIIPL